MKKITYIIIFIISLLSCNPEKQSISDLDIQIAVSSADIHRNICRNTKTIPLYQGNGRFGCSYGALGLHDRPEAVNKYGKTQFMHVRYHARTKFNADYLLPLAKIYWNETPGDTADYSQHQSFYDGVLTTQFGSEPNRIKTTTWFDPVDKDAAGIRIEIKDSAPDIILKPFAETPVHYNQSLVQTSVIGNESDIWRIDMTCENAAATIYLKTDAAVQKENNYLRLRLHKGENNILVSINQPIKTNPAESLGQTNSLWHDKWANTGCLMLPDTDAQNTWIRSMAMFLSSYNDDGLGITPPCGLTGNGWPFGFPQDVSFVHPVLLAAGHINIAKAWVERWADDLNGMKEYTRRLLNTDGILFPWTYPYGSLQGYHTPEPPNKFYYEIHNTGYLARMAHETAIFANDGAWTEKYARPLIKETAEFYKNICTKGDDGLWHLFVTPSMGQDEKGGADQKDYLCALYSAKYCFLRAIEYNLDTDGTYRQILNGLAFTALLSHQGIYYTCAGSGESDFGKQKHPVQLNALAYLPVDDEISAQSRKAYESRYEITLDAKEPFFYGWTLGEFLLAGSRNGNSREWLKDWNNMRPADYVDAEWIQIYETSRSHGMTFYNTTSGLVAQSLLNNLICDWYGKLEIAKCNPWKGKALIRNIRSLLGVTINGVVNEKTADLELTAWKDCSFKMHEINITIKKDETKKISLAL